MPYRIDTKECSRCQMCMDACPADAIERDENFLFFINDEKCIKCGECARVCPVQGVYDEA